jgi:hypothetical protein
MNATSVVSGSIILGVFGWELECSWLESDDDEWALGVSRNTWKVE